MNPLKIILLNALHYVYAHWDASYFRNTNDGFTNRSEWMKNISDHLLLSELALPGTHDSATFSVQDTLISDSVVCQALDIQQQLTYGIRVLDLRIKHRDNRFALYHGGISLNLFLEDILDTVVRFLIQYPSEAVLFRLKKEEFWVDTEDQTGDIEKLLIHYLLKYRKYYFEPTTIMRFTTLGEVRGKFFILDDLGFYRPYGLRFSRLKIQDNYFLRTNWDLYSKWEGLKSHLQLACGGREENFYVHFLSGSGGSLPYFVASGHSSKDTSAPRLLTGLTTFWGNKTYPDFPRVGCFNGWCSIAFEGTNTLTQRYLKTEAEKPLYLRCRRSFGIFMMDFPGDLLIQNIIENNNVYSWRVVNVDTIYPNNTTISNPSLVQAWNWTQGMDENFTMRERNYTVGWNKEIVNTLTPHLANRIVIAASLGFVTGTLGGILEPLKKKISLENNVSRYLLEFIYKLFRAAVGSCLVYSLSCPVSTYSTSEEDSCWGLEWSTFFLLNMCSEVVGSFLFLLIEGLERQGENVLGLSTCKRTLNAAKKMCSFLFFTYPWFMVFFSGSSISHAIDNLFSALINNGASLLGYAGVRALLRTEDNIVAQSDEALMTEAVPLRVRLEVDRDGSSSGACVARQKMVGDFFKCVSLEEHCTEELDLESGYQTNIRVSG